MTGVCPLKQMFPKSHRMFPESHRMFLESNGMFPESHRIRWASAVVCFDVSHSWEDAYRSSWPDVWMHFGCFLPITRTSGLRNDGDMWKHAQFMWIHLDPWRGRPQTNLAKRTSYHLLIFLSSYLTASYRFLSSSYLLIFLSNRFLSSYHHTTS